MFGTKILAVLAAITFGSGLATAGVIFSSFDNPPGTAFVANHGAYAVQGAQFGFVEYAFPFIPGGNFDITQIDLVVSPYTDLYPAAIEVGFYTDLGNSLGTLIGSLNSLTVDAPAGVPGITVISITGVSVVAGAQYWLALLPADPVYTLNAWWVTGLPGSGMYCLNGSTWTHFANVEPYFDVLGTSTDTPEPGTRALLGGGILGLVSILRRRIA